MTTTPAFGESEEDRWLQFVLDEGLTLLAAYRKIADPAMRHKILALVEEAGRATQRMHRERDGTSETV